MTAEKISYKHFRNIAEAEISFSPGVNVLIGDNAEGKTNAIEGIYLMAAGKSFRTSREREMVSFGKPYLEASLTMKDCERSQELSYKIYGEETSKRRETKKNGAPIPRISEMIGVFRAVLFCPEHLAIVKSGPAERRSFLDIAISQIRPVYMKSLSRHNKILTQRNLLLKQLGEGEGDISLLEVYSEQLSREAAFIYKNRLDYVNKLSDSVKLFFDQLSELSGEQKKEAPQLIYKNSLKTTQKLLESEAYEAYLKRLTENIQREIAAGVTLYGSHKDDIEIYLDGKEARQFASQGQQRSLALAMKLGEGEISKEATGEYPVFLFDDVLSELDPHRQKFLLSRLGNRQVIMTACTEPENMEGAKVIRVKNGEYRE